MKMVLIGRSVTEAPNSHAEIIAPFTHCIFPSQISIAVLAVSVRGRYENVTIISTPQ
jgi:hypothetical protein